MGEALRRAIRPRTRCERGTGRCGTSRTSATGAARREEFRKLHDYAIDARAARAARRRESAARTSAGSGGEFTRDFLEHCLRGTNYATGEIGTPLDFVSFHAKGSARRTSTATCGWASPTSSATIDDGFRIVASFPELKDKPIVIGESDPEGCAACQGPQLAYRNGTMYSSYTAASFARKHDLAAQHGVNLEGALTWAFEFEDQPYFAGFRVAGHQRHRQAGAERVPHVLPRWAAERLAAESDAADVRSTRSSTDGVRGAARRLGAGQPATDNKLCVLVWHYHDDDVPGPGRRRSS